MRRGGKLRVYEAHALYYNTSLADVYNAERLLYSMHFALMHACACVLALKVSYTSA